MRVLRSPLAVALAFLVAGCLGPSGDETPAPATNGTEDPGPFRASSAAFTHGGGIPQKFTCDGENTSPPLQIAGAPSGAVAFALIVGDPDAPSPQAPMRNVTHWLAWNVPVGEEGSARFPEGDVPPGTLEGQNVGGENAWTGPCPPYGSLPHRYVFTFFALDAALDLEEGATRDELEAVLDGHVIGETVLVGLYARAIPAVS